MIKIEPRRPAVDTRKKKEKGKQNTKKKASAIIGLCKKLNAGNFT